MQQVGLTAQQFQRAHGWVCHGDQRDLLPVCAPLKQQATICTPFQEGKRAAAKGFACKSAFAKSVRGCNADGEPAWKGGVRSRQVKINLVVPGCRDPGDVRERTRMR